MTQDIPSDRHERKHPSSAEVDTAERLAIMRERLRNSEKRDETILSQLDILIGKISKVEMSMILGEKRFDRIEEKHEETTQSLLAVDGRVTVIEGQQSKVSNQVIGAVGVIGFIGTAVAWAKDWIK